jgi:hypothetical protein
MTGNTEGQEAESQLAAGEESGSKVIELRDLYGFKPEELALEILETYYSNVAYMQVTPRDVLIDFLEAPGIKKEGKTVIGGVRIFMSHVAAQKLAERLSKLLENTYKSGVIERLEFLQPKEVELTTKIERPSTEDQI